VQAFPDAPMAYPRAEPGDGWLEAFHAGERACMERCYRDHFAVVTRAVAAVLAGADRETVVHEVFLRLLTEEDLRRRFGGGSLPAWLRVVARNQAIDYLRRLRVERRFARRPPDEPPPSTDEELRADIRLTLERFRVTVLPARWQRVFVARFVQQQDQPTAARSLGLSRTTLAYQEYRIRHLLRRFLLRGGDR
jgi:RNA polymerase sigma-70 factor (ECF subfamily)